MTIQEIQRLRQEQPFRPFRVLTADGKAYDVLHPEFLAQSQSGRLISIGLPDDSFVMIDLLLVVGVQRTSSRAETARGGRSRTARENT